MSRDALVVTAGAVLAVCLQVVIAPNIALFSAMPNFCIAYAMIVAIMRPANNYPLVLAFVLGLVFDLLSTGPVGAMGFLLVLAAFCASRAFAVFNNDTLFMPIAVMAVAVLIIEVLYAVFMVSFGISASPLDAFVYRALPCALYDCLAALLFYVLALKFLAIASPQSKASTPTQAMQVTMTSAKDLGKVRPKTHRR